MAEFNANGVLPDDWFVYGIGESVRSILYRGERHENTGEGFWCELQHRNGGRLKKATGASPDEAFLNAVLKVNADDRA